ncbi:MAG TPA: alkaline phosphatase D family protein [Thermomicrobiales bacterium]|nr:alkaline phosphatase D family protein [Thermomicrobiales bacterium]
MTKAERDQQAVRRIIRERFDQKAERLLSERPMKTASVNRRTFVLGAAASGTMFTRALSAQEASPMASPVATPDGEPGFSSDPFTLGIASGEPEPDGVVLWTRVAPEPFASDGGVPAASVEVVWEIANDEAMTDIVQQGTYATDAAWAHSVHVEVTGLEPAREYWYRFRLGDYETPVGRTKTAPAPGEMPESFRFAFASCQRWDQGLYTAFRDMAAQAPDLIVHLGDYIYEYGISLRGGLRDNPQRSIEGIPISSLMEILNLDDYRQRHALYKRDPDLQEAHRVAPWIVTWDDHEVNNNFFGQIVRDSPFSKPLLERREAAYRAYWEHMPLRESARPNGPDMLLYRASTFGDLIRFNVLDTRQYRTAQGGTCIDSERLDYDGYCAAALDPDRTLLGADQKQWLFDGFGETQARWNVLAQQVPFSRIDMNRDPEIAVYGDREMDKWDAYAAERNEVLAAMADASRQQGFQPVVITGDVHSNYVWDIKEDWDAPGSETAIGTEFVGTSIASNGDTPLKENGGFTTVCGEHNGNPHNHLYDNHRGYVLMDVTPDGLHSTYRVVSTVEQPDGEISTLASFMVEHGAPGAQADETCEPMRP